MASPGTGGRCARAAAGALAVLLAVAGQAAADPAVVEDLIRKGNELRKQGQDQKAVPLFKRAYDLERSPRTATQLGLVEATLGYWLAAERHLTEALSATRNPWLAKNEKLIRKTLKEVTASIGELDISGPRAASVEVNGQPAGTLPLTKPVRVPEGLAQVILRAPGHKEASTSVRVEGGQRARVTLALVPLPPTLPVVPPPVATVTTPTDKADDPAAKVTRARRRAAGSSWLRNAAWAATVGAVAATGVGFYGLYNQRKYGKAFDAYKIPGTNDQPCYLNGADKGGRDCQRLNNNMKTAQTTLTAGFITAGALAAVATLGFILASPDDDDGPRGKEVALTVQLGDGRSLPLGAGLSGSF